jgi:2-polyprenyl-3-methyl-5-hydroxy-6-metoxy-1,4-benzoquinol methylase
MSKPNRALAFYLQLEAEISKNHDGLDPSYYDCLSRYYKSLKNNVSLRPFYRYSWTRRVTPMLILLHSLPPREPPWRVLDAGCGVGTEAIFWSTLRSDVQVVGVDANVERLRTARARLPYYVHRFPHLLRVSFLNDDVFRVLVTQQFDIIWVMEAISHIDPAETFITQAHSALEPGGCLVISDSNILNPVMAWREFRLRMQGVTHNTPMVTETGAVIRAAAERYFSPSKLACILRKSGFDLIEMHMSVFFPPVLARSRPLFAMATRLDFLLGQLVGLRTLGGIYTLVARSI